MSRKNNLDKFKEVMFSDRKELMGFTQDEKELFARYRFASTLWNKREFYFKLLLPNPISTGITEKYKKILKKC